MKFADDQQESHRVNSPHVHADKQVVNFRKTEHQYAFINQTLRFNERRSTIQHKRAITLDPVTTGQMLKIRNLELDNFQDSIHESSFRGGTS